MSIISEYNKFGWRIFRTSGEVPTFPPSNYKSDGTWPSTAIHKGQFAVNIADERAWYCSDTQIVELVDTNTLFTASTLQSTYIGYGSSGNALTGDSGLTWNGTQVYTNGNIYLDASKNILFGSSTTGIYGTPGGNSIRFNVNGLTYAEIGNGWIIKSLNSNLCGLRYVTATNTNPNILPQYGNVNTGIGGNDNEVSVIANGVEGIRVNSAYTYMNNSVGIGTTSPSYRLDVSGDTRITEALQLDFTSGTTATTVLVASTGGTVSSEYTDDYEFVDLGDLDDRYVNISGDTMTGELTLSGSSSPVTLSNISTNRLRITSSYGYVNLGPANGTYVHFTSDLLTLYTTMALHMANPQIFSYGETDVKIGTNQSYAGAGNIELITSGNTNFILLDDGNVGIGTTTPTYKLEVSGDALISDGLTISDGNLKTDNNDLLIDFSNTGKTLELQQTVYDDIFLGLSTAKVPAANFPDWNTFVGNINQYQFDVGDYLEHIAEIKHGYKEGTDIEIHIHWANDGVDATDRYVKWEVEYTIANMESQGVDITFSSSTVVSAESVIYSTDSDRTHKYTSIGVIDGTNIKIGAIISLRIRRIASTGTAPSNNPFGLMLGLHYEKNTLGSKMRTSK